MPKDISMAEKLLYEITSTSALLFPHFDDDNALSLIKHKAMKLLIYFREY